MNYSRRFQKSWRDYRGKFVAIEVDSGEQGILSGADWLSSGSFVQRGMNCE